MTEAPAQVAQAEAAAERAEEDVANATIRAPIRGTVLTRDVEIGSPVSSILNLGANATLVMTLGDIEQVFVRGKVDEADIGRVRLGHAGAHQRRDLQGQDLQRPRHADLADGRREGQRHHLRGRVSIDNPGQELKANMTANAEIVLEEHADTLVIPEAAITYDAAEERQRRRRRPRPRPAADACR